MLRELDAEPGDGGFELRARLGLEGELGLDRARDAGGEQRLFLCHGQRPERGEGLAVVLDLQPVEGKPRAVRQHRLTRRPALAKSASFMRIVGRSAVSRTAMSRACAL